MQHCADPNKPSYDPATCNDSTTEKLVWLCENAWDKMTAWERKFVEETYGHSPLSRRQHITVWKLFGRYSKPSN